MRLRPLALAAVVLAAACSRRTDEDAKRRVFSHEEAPAAPQQARFDPSRPYDALAISAGEVARRLGAFEWTGAVDWTVARDGDDGVRVHVAERHRIRQSATGDFEVVADVDPGQGPGSETGKEIVFSGGMTYARAKHASFRERPTDHGRDAGRFREDSFELARDLVDLYGPSLRLVADGDTTVLGRTAHRYRVELVQDAGAAPVRHAKAPDDDSARRFAFLDGRVPQRAEGELAVDADTGAPLRVRIAGAFAVKDAPGVHATVELVAEVKTLGERVAAVTPPTGALPDVRKPPGVAGALEAAGLKKTEPGDKKGEPDDDTE